MNLAQRIRDDRTRLGWSQDRLAKEINERGGDVTGPAVSYWEAGKSRPTAPHIVAVARALDWTIEETSEAISQVVGVPVDVRTDSERGAA